MLQADMPQADTRATPCSQPLGSSVTDGIGNVTDIPISVVLFIVV